MTYYLNHHWSLQLGAKVDSQNANNLLTDEACQMSSSISETEECVPLICQHLDVQHSGRIDFLRNSKVMKLTRNNRLGWGWDTVKPPKRIEACLDFVSSFASFGVKTRPSSFFTVGALLGPPSCDSFGWLRKLVEIMVSIYRDPRCEVDQ
jgi:hypothetical protein